MQAAEPFGERLVELGEAKRMRVAHSNKAALDTVVVSELRKVRAGKANQGVAEWASAVVSAPLFISVITLQELEHAVLLSERSDADQGAALRTWLHGSVAAAFAERILPVDEQVARRVAALHVPDPAPVADAFIAATALIHRLVVVTGNVREFGRFQGLDVMNPWH